MKHFKTIKLFAILILFLGITSITFYSCEKNEEVNDGHINSIKTEGTIAFDKTTNSTYVVNDSFKSKDKNVTLHTIKHVFSLEDTTLTFSSNEELNLYIEENKSEVNGVFEIYIDGIKEYSCTIMNGEKIKDKDYNSLKNEARELKCTFQEVKDFAKKRIREQNWYDMAKCILAGFGCVVEKYASCAVDLC
jgi:hypothetical protein